MTGGRMDHKPRRFIDDEKGGILENDGERDRFGPDLQDLRLRRPLHHHVPTDRASRTQELRRT